MKELKIADDEYRNILYKLFGVASSKELTGGQFISLMGVFRDFGYKEKGHLGEREGMATQAQINHICVLWKKYTSAPDCKGLNQWLRKYHKVSHIRFLNKQKAGAAITALLKMVGKRGKDEKYQRKA
ncbi:MAG: regulatory protein GemA [Nitrospinota bacterium]|nr:regulatory protein GemA [Nitrospinota bacterium]